SAIQPIEPWRPCASHSRRRPGASGTASARTTRMMSKPSSRASATSAAFRSRPPALLSEVEVRIEFGWRHAGHMVGEKLPEAGPRLDADIPVLGALELRPGHVAHIVEAGQMRRRSEVRKRHFLAGEPAPLLHEVGNVIEMIAQIVERRADDRH